MCFSVAVLPCANDVLRSRFRFPGSYLLVNLVFLLQALLSLELSGVMCQCLKYLLFIYLLILSTTKCRLCVYSDQRAEMSEVIIIDTEK